MPPATNSKKERDVVLLDLGNVVLGIDPRQVFLNGLQEVVSQLQTSRANGYWTMPTKNTKGEN